MSTHLVVAARLALALTAIAASSVAAQTRTPIGRVVPLTDTLGANFALADSAVRTGSLADYDPLIGTWTFRFQTRNSDSSFNTPIAGHWTFEKKPGGGLIEDRFRPDDPASPMGVSLYTYRVYDPQRKLWQIIGTSSNGGAVQLGLTWSDSTNRYVFQRAGRILVRMRYSAIDADHFLWRSDRSFDNGKTWIRDFAILEATRIGR